MEKTLLFNYDVLSCHSYPGGLDGIVVQNVDRNRPLSFPFSINIWFCVDHITAADQILLSVPQFMEFGVNGVSFFVSEFGSRRNLNSASSCMHPNTWTNLLVDFQSNTFCIFFNGYLIHKIVNPFLDVVPFSLFVAPCFNGLIKRICLFDSSVAQSYLRDIMFATTPSSLPSYLNCAVWLEVQKDSTKLLMFTNTANPEYECTVPSNCHPITYTPLVLLGKTNIFSYNMTNANFGQYASSVFSMYTEFFLEEDGESVQRVLMDRVVSGFPTFGIKFFRLSPSSSQFYMSINFGGVVINGPASVPRQTWVKLAMVYEPHQFSVYVNGSTYMVYPDPSVTPSQTPCIIDSSNSYTCYFGASWNGLHSFLGYMKCFILFDTALSHSSTMELFSKRSSIYDNHVVAYFEMNSMNMLEMVTGTSLNLVSENFKSIAIPDIEFPSDCSITKPESTPNSSMIHACRVLCML